MLAFIGLVRRLAIRSTGIGGVEESDIPMNERAAPPAAAPPAPASPAKVEPRDVIVHGSSESFVQDITIGSHRLVADEPESVGGSDTGPSPYDFLLSALGSCTSMTLSLYARRKQWPLEAVTVRLRHAKIHAADCANCETKTGKIDRIDCHVELHGDLTEEQRARLLEIATKCPVYRTLTSEIDIRTRVVCRKRL